MRKILTDKQVAWAYKMWCIGYTQEQIGDALFVHARTVFNALSKRRKVRPVLVAPPEILSSDLEGIHNTSRIISVEGYKAFTGTMLIKHRYFASEIIDGQWLYKPDTDCWYCGGKSYPAEICEVLEVV